MLRLLLVTAVLFAVFSMPFLFLLLGFVVSVLDAGHQQLGLLMLLQDSRREARVAADGTLATLEEQDRSLWDGASIEEGVALAQ